MEGTMTSKVKVKSDISGLCSGGAAHHLCRGQWVTPSSEVRCRCECHIQVRVLVPKKLR